MQAETFPPRVDFKPDTDSVDDQKQWGSCVAHAGQTVLEVAFSRARTPIDLSRAYLYHWVQQYAGTLGTKDGGYPKDLGPIIENKGCCRELDWPYDKAGVIPPEAVVAKGQEIFAPRTTKYTRLYGVEQIKRALCQGKPVVIGMAVHNAMHFVFGPWTIHTWSTAGNPSGFHAVACIGYDEASKRLLCENSWGPKWGDGGFFGIPYHFVDELRIVTEAYCWDLLPVPCIPVDGYAPASTPRFDPTTGILEMPTLDFYPGNFQGAVRQSMVRVRVLTPGTIVMGNELAAALPEPVFFFKNGNQSQWELRLPLLVIGTDVFKGVVQTAATYELLGNASA